MFACGEGGGSGGESGGGSGGESGSEAGGDGAPCADNPCAEGFYCADECRPQFEGADRVFSFCQRSPSSCPEPVAGSQPVCGCDGIAYPSECHANLAGIDSGGVCDESQWPDAFFPCRGQFCALGSQYCSSPQGDAADSTIYDECVGLPQSCVGLADPTASCDCILAEAEELDELRPLDPSTRELYSIGCTSIARGEAVGITLRYNLFP